MNNNENKKKGKPVTVFKAVQREVSRPYQQQVRQYQKNIRERINKPKQSFTNRIGSTLSKGLSMIQRGGATRALYGQPVAPYGSNIPNIPSRKYTGQKGRPRGSYDKRYEQYGGVYGYRKFLANQLRIQRLEAFRRNAVTPQQQAILQRFEQQARYRQMNPENKVIPDTSGSTPVAGYHQEIERYANLVD